MASDDEWNRIRQQFIDSVKSSIPKNKKDDIDWEILAKDVIDYVLQQVNEFSRLGHINQQQYDTMLESACYGLFVIVEIKHYSDDLIEKDPIYIAGLNFMRLMYSRVYNGRDRDMNIEEIRSKTPIMVQGGR